MPMIVSPTVSQSLLLQGREFTPACRPSTHNLILVSDYSLRMEKSYNIKIADTRKINKSEGSQNNRLQRQPEIHFLLHHLQT